MRTFSEIEKIKVQKILGNLLDKFRKLYISGMVPGIPAYPAWHDCNLSVLIHNIYKLFSITVVRFVEMNF